MVASQNASSTCMVRLSAGIDLYSLFVLGFCCKGAGVCKVCDFLLLFADFKI